MASFILISVFLLLIGLSSSQPTEDLISNLPGLDFNTNYKQYSGYLSLDNGHNLHYWLTESQTNPESTPILLWMNGGPGCSSLDGLLYELGPFHVYDNGTLWDNSKYAWNNYANTIFLEAPVCVGYSYADGESECHMNDNTTANDNYHAILKFLDKFPNYKTNDFYVSGESYAGVYVPTLTLRILQGNANNEGTKINLKGFAVGNGVTDETELENSVQWFYHHHGMISDEVWDDMQQKCCERDHYTRQTCNFLNPLRPGCIEATLAAEETCCSGINPYDLYGPCFKNLNEHGIRKLDESGLLYPYEKLKRHLEFQGKQASPPCVDSEGGTTYLNQDDVREALHIPSNLTVKWSICSNTLKYDSLYSGDMSPIYNQIFSMDPTIYATIYNGDTDTVCNFLGDEWFFDDFTSSIGMNATTEWREWYVDGNDGRQVAGWTRDYQRIHIVTVRGAGHMVPQYRPPEALKMFQYFLENKDLD